MSERIKLKSLNEVALFLQIAKNNIETHVKVGAFGGRKIIINTDQKTQVITTVSMNVIVKHIETLARAAEKNNSQDCLKQLQTILNVVQTLDIAAQKQYKNRTKNPLKRLFRIISSKIGLIKYNRYEVLEKLRKIEVQETVQPLVVEIPKPLKRESIPSVQIPEVEVVPKENKPIINLFEPKIENTPSKESEVELKKESEVELKKESEVELKKESEVELKKESEVELKKESEVELKKESEVELKKESEVELKKESEVELKKESEVELKTGENPTKPSLVLRTPLSAPSKWDLSSWLPRLKPSIQEIAKTWKGLPENAKKNFLLTFLTKGELIKDPVHEKLNRFALIYQEKDLEYEFILHLIEVEPTFDKKIIELQSSGILEKLYSIADFLVKTKQMTPLSIFPLLSGSDQIKLLNDYEGNEKILTPLLSIALKAAESHPIELISSIIKITNNHKAKSLLGCSEEYFNSQFYTRHEDNSKRRQTLYNSAPQFVEVMNAIASQLPKPTLFGIFWNFSNDLNMETKFSEYGQLLESEKMLIRNTPFNVIVELAKYDTSWTKLWYQLGQSDEKLQRTCFSLKPLASATNEKFFLKILSHEDLSKLMKADPTFINLKKIFGETSEHKSGAPIKYEFGFSSNQDYAVIPNILLQWWNIYEKVDLEGRFEMFKTLDTSQKYWNLFEKKHNYIFVKNITVKTLPLSKEEQSIFDEHLKKLNAILADPNKIVLAKFLDDLPDQFVEKMIQYIDSKKLKIFNQKQFLLNVHPDKVLGLVKNPSPLKTGILTSLMGLV